MTQEAYFRREGRELPEGHFTTAGTFGGWVEEGIRKQYDIATCAAAAWDENGGGKFQRTISSAGRQGEAILRPTTHACGPRLMYRMGGGSGKLQWA